MRFPLGPNLLSQALVLPTKCPRPPGLSGHCFGSQCLYTSLPNTLSLTTCPEVRLGSSCHPLPTVYPLWSSLLWIQLWVLVPDLRTPVT